MGINELISEAIARAEELRKGGGVDKKAMNKVIARLEEAWLWSQHIAKSDSLDDAANMASLTQTAPTTNICLCPLGAIDTNCPIHGGKQ